MTVLFVAHRRVIKSIPRTNPKNEKSHEQRSNNTRINLNANPSSIDDCVKLAIAEKATKRTT